MRPAATFAVLSIIGGCTLLPSSGPVASAFAPNSSRDGGAWADAGFLLVPVDDRTLAAVRPEERPSLRLLALPHAAPSTALSPGDAVAVTIFEADVGGLFSSGGVAGGGSPMTRLPEQTIGADGGLTIPYAGRVSVAGLSTQQAERRITAALAGRAIEPQAMVAVTAGPARSLTVTGDAVAGRQVLLPEGGLRLLDAVASAGGPTAPIFETAVRLTRDGRSVQLPFAVLAADPGENVALAAGDAILVTRQPRTVVVLGAFGRNAELPLADYDTTLAQVLAQAGGLDALQANATGVFLLRDVSAGEAIALGAGPLLDDGRRIAVAFRFNLREPSGLVLARRFAVRDGDAVFTATAPFAELRNALAVFQGIGAPAASGATAMAAF